MARFDAQHMSSRARANTSGARKSIQLQWKLQTCSYEHDSAFRVWHCAQPAQWSSMVSISNKIGSGAFLEGSICKLVTKHSIGHTSALLTMPSDLVTPEDLPMRLINEGSDVPIRFFCIWCVYFVSRPWSFMQGHDTQPQEWQVLDTVQASQRCLS